MLHRVLEQLVDHQRERRRLLARQAELVPLDPGVECEAGRRHRLRHGMDHPFEHRPDRHLAQAFRREDLVHGRDAQDPVDRLGQHLPARHRPAVAELQAEEHRDHLQVVLDAMVHLADHRRLDHEAGVLDGERGLVRQRL